MMMITVKTAHSILRTCFLRGSVLDALWKARESLSKHSVMFQANCALFKEDALYRNEKEALWKARESLSKMASLVAQARCEVLIYENVFNPVYAQCTDEDRRILRACLEKGSVLRDFRSKVTLNVEPCMKVGALKSLLKAKPWIPEENLVLVKVTPVEDDSIVGVGARPLEDDSSTLHDCGIEGGDILLACMSGSFPLTVVEFNHEPDEGFVIPISSCFETIGDLKKRIHQKRDIDDFVFIYQNRFIGIYQNRFIGTMDSIPLVAYGIVRQYLNVPESSKSIEMLPQSKYRDFLDNY